MSCWWARKLESEALDRLLPDDVETRFHEHLSTCAACRQRFRQLERLKPTLADMERVSAPRELETAVRAVWHPTLRRLPILRPYPYLRGAAAWNLRQLRLVGHLAGMLVTGATFLLVLQSFGNFPLNSSHIAGPGIYTYLTRPSASVNNFPAAAAFYSGVRADGINVHTTLSLGATRLNDYTLTRFADGETQAIHEDSLSVLTSLDAGGKSTIEGVLHSPRDPNLFLRFGQLLSTSQIDLPAGPPNSRGHMVLTFSRIFVTS